MLIAWLLFRCFRGGFSKRFYGWDNIQYFRFHPTKKYKLLFYLLGILVFVKHFFHAVKEMLLLMNIILFTKCCFHRRSVFLWIILFIRNVTCNKDQSFCEENECAHGSVRHQGGLGDVHKSFLPPDLHKFRFYFYSSLFVPNL